MEFKKGSIRVCSKVNENYFGYTFFIKKEGILIIMSNNY